jgi:PKD repeat protein/invasion protein IalB
LTSGLNCLYLWSILIPLPMIRKTTLFVLAVLFSFTAFSQQTTSNQNLVDSLFQNKKEIIFQFSVSSRHEIDTLTRIISIDNVKGNDIYAYANKAEFTKFLTMGYPYSIIDNTSKNINAYTMATTVAQMSTWDRYPTYSVYTQMMAQFQANYPSLCNLDTILASTPDGHAILVLKISDNVNTAENEPQFLYSSSMHGDETTGYVLMLRLIDYLLSNYGTNTKVTNLVNNAEIWICPLANPDGTYNSGNTIIGPDPTSIRYNSNSIDLNRNYPDPRAGQNPDGNSTQPETQAFITFANNHYFNMSANFHGGAEVFNFPWDTWTTASNPHADASWWTRMGRQYVDTARIYLSTYMSDTYANGVTEGGDWYVITGGRQDYMNYFKYCREVTIELDADKTTETQNLPSMWTYNYRSMLNYIQESLYGVRGIVTDSCSGLPIRAKVYVNSHEQNNDSSFVYSSPIVGNYHRYLINGTYSVTYSAPGYTSRTINNIVLANSSATTVNVKLKPAGAPDAVFTADNTTTCSGIINFTNTSTGGVTWLWTFGDGNTSTLQNPSHTYTTSGTYTVKLKIYGCNGNDSLVRTNYITVNLATAPTTTDGSRCGTGTVALSAAGTGTLNWYDAATAGNLVNTGTLFTTPSLTTTTTYYVESVVIPAAQSAGKADNTGGGGNNTGSSNYLIFDCYTPVTLVSVVVYPTGAGNRTIELRNSSGTVLQTATINLTTASPQTVPLNFQIPVGTSLQLGISTGTTVNLYRNNAGVSYPYTTTGLVSITGSSAGASYYYFFYNWQIQEPGCTSSRTPVTATINTALPASISFAANPTGAICGGTSVTFTATATNGGTTPTYQWKKNGANIGGATTSIYTSSTLANSDAITCEMTSNASCVSGSPATSNTITMTVNAGGAASVSIAANPVGAICGGTSVTFTATPTNGGTATYQWKLNGTNISGATNSTYTSTTLATSDAINCVMTSSLSCATGSPATSNNIAMTVYPSVPVSVIVAANPGSSICTGTSVTFTATATNGGASPAYQWKKNGTNIGGATASTYTSSTLANSDIITCVLTSTVTCGTGSPATSNAITMNVNAGGAASVSIAANPIGAICSETSVTFTATATNGGTATYQWKLNGSNITGATNSTYTSTTLATSDAITCVMASSLSCATGSPATSNSIAMTVYPSVPVSVIIAANPGSSICTGTSVIFTATATNGGASPAYQWKKNATNITGATTSTYTSSTLATGDIITCILTSTVTCATGSPATSNAITMSVNAGGAATVSIAANPTGAICSGTSVTFTATPTNGGIATYQWKLNGSNITSATNSTYTSTTLANSDAITCLMTSSLSCATGSPATSNTITMTIASSLPASISIVADPSSSVCMGEQITFNATPINPGTSPIYQWQLNGSNVGANSTTYLASSINNGDLINCFMISSESCATGNPASSNTITVTVYNTPATPVISQSGDSLFSNAASGNQWYFHNALGGMSISGAITPGYLPLVTGDYYVIVTDINGCVSDTSNIISVVITDISEIENAGFNIYPNPTKGIFEISFAKLQANTKVQIINAIGTILVEKELNNQSTVAFDARKFASGLYFIKITTDKNTALEKLIIQK